jgi:hypothetical protein
MLTSDTEVVVPGLIRIIRQAAVAGVLAATVAGCAAGHAQVARAQRPAAVAHARTAAQARWLPGLYLGSMGGNWHGGPFVRPSELFLGADWTVSKLRWTFWNRRHAEGRGYWVACGGAGGPCDMYWATMAASHVSEHDGSRYFAIMKVTGRHQPVQWLVMDRFGNWQQSDRP